MNRTYEVDYKLGQQVEEANDACDALTLTRNGTEIGVVVSVEEWRRLSDLDDPRKALDSVGAPTQHTETGRWLTQAERVTQLSANLTTGR